MCAELGYGSFVRSALPAVVFDECLWWLLSKTQDLFSRKAGLQGEGYSVAAFSIVLLSLRPKLALGHWEDRRLFTTRGGFRKKTKSNTSFTWS